MIRRSRSAWILCARQPHEETSIQSNCLACLAHGHSHSLAPPLSQRALALAWRRAHKQLDQLVAGAFVAPLAGVAGASGRAWRYADRIALVPL